MVLIQELLEASINKLQAYIQQQLQLEYMPCPETLGFELLYYKPQLVKGISKFINEDPSLSFVFNHQPDEQLKIRGRNYRRSRFDTFMLDAYDILTKITKKNVFMNSFVKIFYLSDLHKKGFLQKAYMNQPQRLTGKDSKEARTKKMKEKRKTQRANKTLRQKGQTAKLEVEEEEYERVIESIEALDNQNDMIRIELNYDFLKMYEQNEKNNRESGTEQQTTSYWSEEEVEEETEEESPQ